VQDPEGETPDVAPCHPGPGPGRYRRFDL